MNIFKDTKFYSIFWGKCPVCHQGKLYQTRHLYRFSETLKMPEHCSSCGLKYKIEPSFFYGAMYVSYGVGIIFAAVAFLVSYLLIGFDRLATFFMICGTLVLSLPIILRLSRNIWINLFFKFNPTAQKKIDQ